MLVGGFCSLWTEPTLELQANNSTNHWFTNSFKLHMWFLALNPLSPHTVLYVFVHVCVDCCVLYQCIWMHISVQGTSYLLWGNLWLSARIGAQSVIIHFTLSLWQVRSKCDLTHTPTPHHPTNVSSLHPPPTPLRQMTPPGSNPISFSPNYASNDWLPKGPLSASPAGWMGPWLVTGLAWSCH